MAYRLKQAYNIFVFRAIGFHYIIILLMVFMYTINREFGAFNTIFAKLEMKSDVSATLKLIETFHTKFNPNFPFSYKFLDQDFQNLYTSERKLSILSRYFAILAIIISCLGLFGLTTFTVNKRKKEISIRKVMGSTGYQIIILLFKDISKLVSIALLIGIPLCYYFTQDWLENFAERIDLDPWFFILTGGLFFILMILASGFQIVRTLSINPAKTLRDEN
ncbi:hypothetical protein LCGC14_0266390 [marine sediment metagenome]|uniref:ABC3 transporter permease C-terminal domain-containing protein n=1 Tax=marine sediment metagenome TaxID=412755 RepID=A0A0F9WKX7_9ZZZZ|nr:FtsX-like permease family protein [Maribacter sp.]HDZ03423.1 FtsX-like permease family protein [Maribacter sp.]HEA79246.1 FtsX-like permease family protein [Maribacter sp.]